MTPPSWMCLDGNMEHFKLVGNESKYTLVLVGTSDSAHVFHPVALGVMSGAEAARETSIFLSLLDNHLKTLGYRLPRKWLLDGARGLRDGLIAWHKKCEREEETKEKLTIGMCYYHMMAAIRMKSSLLPGGVTNIGQALFDIENLSELTPSHFSQGWLAVKAKWMERNWAVFVGFFERTYIDKLSGWGIGTLGRGTPRTTNGLEGSWPTVHLFISGRVRLPALLEDLLLHILPYFERNMKVFSTLATKALSLDERKDAVALTRETSEALVRRNMNNVEWFYCKKRANGVRTPITQEDIQRYETAAAQPEWDYSDFCFLASIRKFNLDDCNCRKNKLYLRCHHRRAVAIKLGLVTPNAIDEPDDPKRTAGRPKASGTIRKFSSSKSQMTYCFICLQDCKSFHNLRSHFQGAAHIGQMQKVWVQLYGSQEPLSLSNKISLVRFERNPELLTAGQHVLIAGDVLGQELFQGRIRAVELRGPRTGYLHVSLTTGDQVVEPNAICAIITETGDSELKSEVSNAAKTHAKSEKRTEHNPELIAIENDGKNYLLSTADLGALQRLRVKIS